MKIMKKIYEMPETKVIKVALSAMIATSDPKVTVDTEEPAIDAEDVESRRRRNVWDEEEEDF